MAPSKGRARRVRTRAPATTAGHARIVWARNVNSVLITPGRGSSAREKSRATRSPVAARARDPARRLSGAERAQDGLAQLGDHLVERLAARLPPHAVDHHGREAVHRGPRDD